MKVFVTPAGEAYHLSECCPALLTGLAGALVASGKSHHVMQMAIEDLPRPLRACYECALDRIVVLPHAHSDVAGKPGFRRDRGAVMFEVGDAAGLVPEGGKSAHDALLERADTPVWNSYAPAPRPGATPRIVALVIGMALLAMWGPIRRLTARAR